MIISYLLAGTDQLLITYTLLIVTHKLARLAFNALVELKGGEVIQSSVVVDSNTFCNYRPSHSTFIKGLS
jgi:hypothetical protein